MDATVGDCWNCKIPTQGITVKCTNCHVAEYCSIECRNENKLMHNVRCKTIIEFSRCTSCKSIGTGLMTCYGCFNAVYCNQKCQKKDWPNHKNWCRDFLDKIIDKEAQEFLDEVEFPYPWYHGSGFSEDYLNLRKNEGISSDLSLKLLFLGVGDIKNVVKTIMDLPEEFTGSIKFVLNDFSPHVMARNILFMYYALILKNVDHMIQIWYSFLLTHKCKEELSVALEALLSKDNDSILKKLHAIIEISSNHWEKCQLVWKGWLDLMNDPNALERIGKQRSIRLKYSVLRNHLKDSDMHDESLKAFFDTGIFMPFHRTKRSPPKHLNPTVTSFNPSVKAHDEMFPDINRSPLFFAECKDAVFQECDMIYAIPEELYVIHCWDFFNVIKTEGMKSDLLEMLSSYLEKVYNKFIANLDSKDIRFHFIVDDFREVKKYLPVAEKFDRISTSNLSDYYSHRFLFEHFAFFLNRRNKHAVIICREELWCSFNQQYKLKHFLVRNLTNPHDISIPPFYQLITPQAFEADYLDLPSVLFWQLVISDVCYRMKANKSSSKTPLENPSVMAKKFGLRFRDFRKELNRVIPYQRQGSLRTIFDFPYLLRHTEWSVFESEFKK